jgi:hypothetical protein
MHEDQHTQYISAQHGFHSGPSHTSEHVHQVHAQSPVAGQGRWTPELFESHGNHTSVMLMATHVLEPVTEGNIKIYTAKLKTQLHELCEATHQASQEVQHC